LRRPSPKYTRFPAVPVTFAGTIAPKW
jgi:hypothetical protein